MKLTKEVTLELCKIYAPKYELDPFLVMAVIEQESAYETHARRLEQGFYWRYTRNDPRYNDVDEALLAISWGLMQMMGASLDAVGYFQERQTSVYDALIAYLDFPEKQVETGCKWLHAKMVLAKGDIAKGLGYWNGDQTGKYAGEVLARYKTLSAMMRTGEET